MRVGKEKFMGMDIFKHLILLVIIILGVLQSMSNFTKKRKSHRAKYYCVRFMAEETKAVWIIPHD